MMVGNNFVGTGLKFLMKNHTDLKLSKDVISELLRTILSIGNFRPEVDASGTIESVEETPSPTKTQKRSSVQDHSLD
jgi:hypothetical protein